MRTAVLLFVLASWEFDSNKQRQYIMKPGVMEVAPRWPM